MCLFSIAITTTFVLLSILKIRFVVYDTTNKQKIKCNLSKTSNYVYIVGKNIIKIDSVT